MTALEYYTHHFAQALLWGNSQLFLVTLMLLGLAQPSAISARWARLLALCFCSMLLNTALKYYFAVPLANQPNWYAFPSGHLQFATVFYGFLIFGVMQYSWRAQKPWGLLFAWLGILAWATHRLGYHAYFDMGAGVVIGLLMLAAYHYAEIQLSRKNRDHHMVQALAAVGILTFMSLGLWVPYAHVPWHAWLAVYVLVPFALCYNARESQGHSAHYGVFIGGLMLLWLAHQGNHALVHAKPAVRAMPYLAVGLCVPLLRRASVYLARRHRNLV